MVKWLRQPTTVIGVGVLVGGIVGYVVWILTHDGGSTLLGASLAAGIVKIALPDNTTAGAAVQTLVSDALTALVQKNVRAAVLKTLLGDAEALFAAIQPPTTATTTTTTTTQVASGDHPQEKTP